MSFIAKCVVRVTAKHCKRSFLCRAVEIIVKGVDF